METTETNNTEITKNLLATLLSIFVLALWAIPIILVQMTDKSYWGLLYLLITLITLCWGNVIHKHYYEKRLYK